MSQRKYFVFLVFNSAGEWRFARRENEALECNGYSECENAGSDMSETFKNGESQ